MVTLLTASVKLQWMETLIQLAGRLKGQALQEWNLLEDSDKVGWFSWQNPSRVSQSREY